MMNKTFLLIVLLFLGLSIHAQHNGSIWKILSSLMIETEYDEMTGIETYKPTFFPNVLELEGQEIEVEGYIIPLTGKIAQSHFMFSAYPSNMCFFCGKAGPESAMQVFMKDSKKVKYSDNKIKIKGTFKINRDLKLQMFYNLENAEVL